MSGQRAPARALLASQVGHMPMHNMGDVADLNCWCLVKNMSFLRPVLESLIDESVKLDPFSLAEGNWEPLRI